MSKGASSGEDRAVVNGAASVSALRDGIPGAQYDAMRRLLDPMINAAEAMSVDEVVLAMQGLYATSQTNCPWYAYGLRHTLPPILATIGSGKDGYEEAWEAQAIEARRAETGTGSVHESAVGNADAPETRQDTPETPRQGANP